MSKSKSKRTPAQPTPAPTPPGVAMASLTAEQRRQIEAAAMPGGCEYRPPTTITDLADSLDAGAMVAGALDCAGMDGERFESRLTFRAAIDRARIDEAQTPAPKPSAVGIDATDVRILRAMATRPLYVWTDEAIETAAALRGERVSRKTIGRRRPGLLEASLTGKASNRPGMILTDAGRDTAKNAST